MSRKKDLVSAEEREIQEAIKRCSVWTPLRKACVAAVAAAVIGLGGLHAYGCHKENERQEQYLRHVGSVLSEYDYPPSNEVLDSALVPGSAVDVLRDSLTIYGVQSDRMNVSVENQTRNDSRLMIRPVDGGQEVSLESEVRISRISYGDVEGSWSYRTGLKLIPSIPDIFPHDFRVDSVEMNGKMVPLRYVEGRRPAAADSAPYFYVDIRHLVSDGLLSEDDFEGDLEVRIRSHVSVGEASRFFADDASGREAYGALPDEIARYARSSARFPSDHRRIQDIVADYAGSGSVADIMRYAMEFTDSALEYYTPELYLDPVEVLDDGRGDCDDYAGLFVTILRGFGVPAKVAEGPVTRSGSGPVDGAHAWAEVYVPFKDGSGRWVLVEPTWADDRSAPYSYMGFNDQRYLYAIDFDVELDTQLVHERYDVFQRHRWVSSEGEGDDDGAGCAGEGGC